MDGGACIGELAPLAAAPSGSPTAGSLATDSIPTASPGQRFRNYPGAAGDAEPPD
jgi:hypothetical protein